jgi:hypothetical protein
MKGLTLECPKCGHEAAYQKEAIDNCSALTCSECGFDDVPTGFTLVTKNETKSTQFLKMALIIAAGFFFVTIGLYMIIMLVWIAPFLLAALIFYKQYQRWKHRGPIRS